MARTMLIYGKTGSYKSSNLGQIVSYLCQRFGGVVRGVFGDNRGPLQTQVNSGELQPWDITTHSDPLGCLIAVGKGYWPTRLVDGVAVGPLKMTTPDEWLQVASVLCEGLTENGALIMRDREDKNVSTGEPLVGVALEQLTGTPGLSINYAMGSRGTYQFAQIQTHRYVKNGFAKLPVPWAIFTAHEKNTLDKYNNRVCGPVIVGKALIEHISQWFDLTLHLDTYFYDHVVKKGAKPIKRQGSRAYFMSHQDQAIPTAIWPAKLGVPPELFSQILEKYPEGYVSLVLDQHGFYVSSVKDLLVMIDEHSDNQLAQPLGEESSADETGSSD